MRWLRRSAKRPARLAPAAPRRTGVRPEAHASGRPAPALRLTTALLIAFITEAHAESLTPHAPSAPAAASAAPWKAPLESLTENEMRAMASDPALTEALAKAAEHGYLTDERLHELEEIWKREEYTPEKPLRDSITRSPAADRLREILDKSDGLYTELFLLDRQGMTVAATRADGSLRRIREPFWKQTAERHSLMPFTGEPGFNEDTGLFQAFAAVSVLRAEKFIGLLVAGADVERFDGRF